MILDAMQLVGCSECCHAVSRVHERFGRCYAVLRVFFDSVYSVLGGLNFLFKYLS